MTALTKVWGGPSERLAAIGGDRRGERRYGLGLEIRWKLLHRRKVLDSGTGRTRDLSSHGILFVTRGTVPLGANLEVEVSWPALLHGLRPLKLMAAGRVVRSDATGTAIRMTQHEFRTAGGSAQRAALVEENASANASVPVWNLPRSEGAVKLQ